jgi:hypothetical protein
MISSYSLGTDSLVFLASQHKSIFESALQQQYCLKLKEDNAILYNKGY